MKGKFFVTNGLLYHYDTVCGHRTKQLVLTECRRNIVMKFAHDAPFAGHGAWQRTRQLARLAVFWPALIEDITKWGFTCEICQKHKPVNVADLIPITPVPRD